MRTLAILLCAACAEPLPVTPDAPPNPQAPDAALDAPPPTDDMLALTGAIAPIHDPSIIAAPGMYYIFSTGENLPIHASPDLLAWSDAGTVFASAPAWITTANGNNLWAPDISYFNGEYHLYYAASTFGSNTSCIGHATTESLESPAWVDRGPVICSTAHDDWNALDPAATLDDSGAPWLAFGSFWSGLQIIPLAPDGSRDGEHVYPLATRPNTAVEAAYLVHRAPYYYLFESVDYCCQGVASNYKIMATRAAAITGPYVDAAGTPALEGGGTLVVTGDSRWRGPGHNAVLHGDRDYNVYHAYDAQNGGAPTLRIAELGWSADGWPISAGP